MDFDESSFWGISNIVACRTCVWTFISFVHCPKPDESRCSIHLHTIVILYHFTTLQHKGSK